MTNCVVKIDLVASKAFATQHEDNNPTVRAQVLKKLLDVSKNRFPASDQVFPSGSFYKAEGDAVIFVIRHASVALRACIEFMQEWYGFVKQNLPECRIIIDRGTLDEVTVPGGSDFTGRVFENINVMEKEVDSGQIYLTQEVINNCDSTMANFVLYRRWKDRKLTLYKADFLDPRTVEDSRLVHALFVAHPQAEQARERVFELFLSEYLLEKNKLKKYSDLKKWADERGYSLPPQTELSRVARSSKFFDAQVDETSMSITLSDQGQSAIQSATQEYDESKTSCIETVREAVVTETRSGEAVKGCNFSTLIEEYLSAVFSEIRLMAN